MHCFLAAAFILCAAPPPPPELDAFTPIPTVSQMLVNMKAADAAEVAAVEEEIKEAKKLKAMFPLSARKARLELLQDKLNRAKNKPPRVPPRMKFEVGSYGAYDPETFQMKVSRVLDGGTVLADVDLYIQHYKIVGAEMQKDG